MRRRVHNGRSWEPGEICWVCWCCPSLLAQNGAGALPVSGIGGHRGVWCPGQDGPKALPDVAVPVLSFYLLLHCWFISFRWWQHCEIFQEPQCFPWKLGWQGKKLEKRLWFFSNLVQAFVCLGFFPHGDCPARYFRLVFTFEKFLWNNQMIWGCVRCFCILSPNHLGEKE